MILAAFCTQAGRRHGRLTRPLFGNFHLNAQWWSRCALPFRDCALHLTICKLIITACATTACATTACATTACATTAFATTACATTACVTT